MSRLSNLVRLWVIAWLCLGSVRPSKITINCLQFIPPHFWNSTVYDQTSQELHLNYNLSDLPKLSQCLNQTAEGTVYTLQLVSVLEEDGDRDACCDLQCKSAIRYHEQPLEQLLASERRNQTVSLPQLVPEETCRVVPRWV